MKGILCFVALIIPLLGSVAAMASDDWTLTTGDLHSRVVQLHGIDATGVTVSAAATQPSRIELSNLVSLERDATAAATTSRWSIQLHNGDIFAGEPVSLEGETLHWHEDLIGPIDVAMSSVAWLHSRGESENSRGLKQPATLDDNVQLSNGDTVHGVVTDINAEAVSVQRSNGSVAPVPMESIAQVQFAATASASTTASAASNPSFRIALSDGSAIASRDLQMTPSTLLVTVNGTPKRLPLEDLQSVEQINGPVTWLSDCAPSEDVQIPMLGPVRPTQFNRSASGSLIRFGERRFVHGIGVHAYSKLTWPIGPGEQAFRTQFAIDGDLPLAAVTVRIKLDDRVVSETRDVRAGQLRPVIFLDVRGRHSITLEVEDTTNDDVQARLNWIEPALLRDLPESMGTIDADVSNKSGSR